MDEPSRAYYYTASGISYSISALLIFLVVNSSPASMRNYSVVVLDGAIGDILLATADALAEVSLVPIGHGFALTFRGVCAYYGDFFCFVCYALAFLSFYHLVLISLFSFYYRYHSLRFTKMSRWMVIAVCLAMWIVMTTASFGVLLFISAPRDETAASLKKLYPTRNYTVFHGLGREEKDNYGILLIVILLVYCSISNCLIFFFRRKIDLIFRSQHSFMSPNTVEMHHQLMKVLTIQSLIPWMLTVALVSFAIHIFYFKNSVLLDNLAFVIIGVVPLFNSSVSIIFIMPYRRALLRILKLDRFLSAVTDISSTAAASSSYKFELTSQHASAAAGGENNVF